MQPCNAASEVVKRTAVVTVARTVTTAVTHSWGTMVGWAAANTGVMQAVVNNILKWNNKELLLYVRNHYQQKSSGCRANDHQ